jgi:hypothetical protein
MQCHEYPRTIDIFESCFVKVDEFCKSAPAHHLNHPEEGVYLVWKWNWTPTYETPNTMDSHSCSLNSETEQQGGTETIQHTSSHLDTVRFKVIGATRDKHYQDALEQANEVLRSGQEVYVALQKEPENPNDSMAIAFKCYLNGKWHTIGYVVREALNDVHEALCTNSIQTVKFGWVKFRIDFQRSGPGFYAGVDITRIGHWSSRVYNCASPK